MGFTDLGDLGLCFAAYGYLWSFYLCVVVQVRF